MASGQVAVANNEEVNLSPNIPLQLKIAKEELGQTEYLPKNKRKPNPRVSNYFIECGASPDPLNTPWCAYFHGFCVKRAGYVPTNSGMARSYLNWGSKIDKLSEAKPGDTIVLWRGKTNDSVTGHIGFYIKHNKDYIWLLGGNQGDEVSIAAFPIKKLLGIRRPRNVTIQSKTIIGATGSGAAQAAATAIKSLEPTKIDNFVTKVDETKSILEPIAPYIPLIVGLLTCISIALMIYVVWVRYNDYKETGL